MEDPPPPVTLWEAQYAYEARRPGEVSLLPGDLLEVPKGDQQGAPGWLLGTSRRTGQSGYFPASFVRTAAGPVPAARAREEGNDSGYCELGASPAAPPVQAPRRRREHRLVDLFLVTPALCTHYKIHAKGDKEGTDLTLSCLPESGRGGGPSGRAGPHVRAVGCPREQSLRAGRKAPLFLSPSLLAASASDPRRSNRQGDVSRVPARWGHGGEAGDARVSSQDGYSPKARNGALRLAVGQLGARFPRPKGLIREVERAAPTIPPSSRS
ncbi:hypothetical protein HPB47_002839 [Ixodes persulcatus]|uniref:Uncharacterized protein n=1 Tax=Ixodes persulcatus TaxID=34615 RepID=A0AC60PKH7_IXOPE|nr:hypothetical protein HPB47_002839 [Ixodes persulcatus]